MSARSDGRRGGGDRTCVVTRRAGSPDDLIRFVVGPGEELVPDLRRKLPGRGVWAGAEWTTVEQAVRRKAFERALKTKVTVPPDLPARIDALMWRDALQALAMANKAGLVSAGFSKVEAAAAGGRGRIAAVIAAAEGAADGRRKIGQALRRGGDELGSTPLVTIFAGADLELALGRAHVIHAALAPGPAAEGFLARWRRLVRYRADGADQPVPGQPPDPDDIDEDNSEPAGP